jgi:tetratricopeptide (TPR) repeat protein
LRQLGDDEGLAFALRGLAWRQRARGDLAKARAALEEAIELFTRLGRTITTRLLDLGALALEEGDADAARHWFERGVVTAGEEGDVSGEADAHFWLADLALDRGDLDAAERGFYDSLDVARRLHGHADATAAESIVGMSAIALARGEPTRAGRLWEVAVRLAEELDESVRPLVERRRPAVERMLPQERAEFERGRQEVDELSGEGVISEFLRERRARGAAGR